MYVCIRITCVSCVYTRREIEKRTHTGRFVRVTRGTTGSQLAHSSGHSGRELLLREGRSPASLFVSYQLARRLHLATITASASTRSNSSRPRTNPKLAEFPYSKFVRESSTLIQNCPVPEINPPFPAL